MTSYDVQIFMALKYGQLPNKFNKSSPCIHMVNILKFQTLVACQKDLDKQSRPRLLLISVLPVGYSDKHFVNWSPDNQHLFENRKRKAFETLEHLVLPYQIN